MATYLYDWPTNGHYIHASDICVFLTYCVLPSTGTSLSSTQHLFWWAWAGSLAQWLLQCCLHQPVNSTCELHSRGTRHLGYGYATHTVGYVSWTYRSIPLPIFCINCLCSLDAYWIHLATWLDLRSCDQRNNQSNCKLIQLSMNNQQMQLYAINFIPLLCSLYMFRVFYTPIIRSTIFNCIYSHWYKP